jgi:hypothetical protein
MKKITFLVLAAILILFGCVPSLHELYTEEILIFDPNLAGKWQASENETWEFVPDAQKKSYGLLINEEKDKKSELTAHLVNIKGQRFLDLYPEEPQTGVWQNMCLVPAHLFLHVQRTEPNLVVVMMDPDGIKDLLEEKPEMIKHERTKDRLVLTDTTEHLQDFVIAGLTIEKFYGDPGVLERIKPAEPNQP